MEEDFARVIKCIEQCSTRNGIVRMETENWDHHHHHHRLYSKALNRLPKHIVDSDGDFVCACAVCIGAPGSLRRMSDFFMVRRTPGAW